MRRFKLLSRYTRPGLWLLAAALLAGLFILSGSAAFADETVDVTIDAALQQQLAASPGGVPAVITTWDRSGLDAVEQLGVNGTRLRALPMLLTASLTPAELDALSSSPAVRSVFANHHYELYTEDSTWAIGAREVWSAPAAGGFGVTGEDVHVAVIDTGADGLHEDMDNLVEFCETQQALTSDHTTVLCSPFDAATGNAGPAGPNDDARLDGTDDNGHGSHVSGTIAGSGDASGGREALHSTIGVAPDAKLHVYSANVGPSLANHEILAAYDDLIHKKELGLSTVVAVSNSWGGGAGSNYAPGDPVHVAIEAAYDLGILSVFAAGNDGPEHNTLSRQCVSPYVVCVAASTKNDAVVMFSSRGRPSEPADTNRDGIVGGPGDVLPDNHDRALAQALGLGVYRPTVTAPGVNINAISANAALCREGPIGFDMECYEPLNGTSMATPHVTGVVALITEAYRQGHGGETPSPAVLTDIIERSANVSKLPGYEADEQGAGRLNAHAAVSFALTYPNGLPPVNWGTATPPYAADAHPGGTAAARTETGCTSELSWSTNAGYGQHTVTVPDGVDRLRITADWSEHPSANLYLRLWRPGVDPDAESEPAGPDRVFPDQESLGLVFVGTSRWLDVRAPEAGAWTLRVYHRAGGAPLACDPASAEDPKQTTGFNYDLTIETPAVTETPSATITSPHEGETLSGRFVTVEGEAEYPTPWNGVTNWSVPGSEVPSLVPAPGERPVFHFQGNVEEGCTGDGAADIIACGGPFLREESALSANPAATWKVSDPLIGGTADRTIYDPNWIWNLDEPTALGGYMTVEFWASCGACGSDIGLSADWNIRLWADGALVFERRLSASPLRPNQPQKLELTVNVPTVTATDNFVLHVDPVYIDSQIETLIYYDSAEACPGLTGGACDSLVHMPVIEDGGAHLAAPANVRVTDRHGRLQVAWDPVAGATEYLIYRDTDPAFDPAAATPLAATAGEPCNAPDVPSWPGASRSGLCFADQDVAQGATYYYRVIASDGATTGDPSLLSYGAATAFDRQVKVGFDRLWGPRVWEYASLQNAAATLWEAIWDTLELDPEATGISARSFTQGIGSATADVQPPPPPPPPGDAVKVTGGGKAPGATPPAEGIKEATFGFVVQPRAGAPQGNLEFHDHETGVHIRAISFDSLSVDGDSCAFSGEAEVTRGDETAVESFTVTCVDRGPKGEDDAFNIQTESYTGGGALTGGNVKIHH